LFKSCENIHWFLNFCRLIITGEVWTEHSGKKIRTIIIEIEQTFTFKPRRIGMIKRVIRAMVMSGAIAFFGSTVLNAATPYPGYTFFATGKKAYLYDMNKTLVHSWVLPYTVVGNAVLNRDSSIYYTSQNTSGWTGGGALTHGRFQRIEWDGTTSWTFTYVSSTYCPHHNFSTIYYTNDPSETPNILAECVTSQGDKVVEIKPTGTTTADIVWEWNPSQHMGDNDPGLLSSSKGGMSGGGGGMGGSSGAEWMHVNFVSFHRGLNQVAINAKHFKEILIVDHSTTTAQAATRSGGIYGKGGDILYRWGNPSNYGASGTAQLNGQHCGLWVPDTFPGTTDTLPGRRNVMFVDNGNKRAVEIVPSGTGNGTYPLTTGAAYAPASPLWTRSFAYAGNEGSAQRLPNGNTLLCSGGVSTGGGGSTAKILEVSPTGDSLWVLSPGVSTTLAWRYALTYMGNGTTHIASNPVNTNENLFSIETNSLIGQATIRLSSQQSNAFLSVYTVDGALIYSTFAKDRTLTLNTGNLGRGIFIAKVTANGKSAIKRFAIAR
jgi:hypothetical protein